MDKIRFKIGSLIVRFGEFVMGGKLTREIQADHVAISHQHAGVRSVSVGYRVDQA